MQHALHSVLHITTETAQTPHTIITEKSYKPFLMMQPFITIGNQYNIARLREMGLEFTINGLIIATMKYMILKTD